MTRAGRVAGVVVLATVLVFVGIFGVVRERGSASPPAAPTSPDVSQVLRPVVTSGSLEETIASLQDRLRAVPSDASSYASLGLAYVQQARITADPSYYPKAEGALQRSLELNPDDNEAALVGMASLAAARHDFSGALAFGQRARTLNPYDGNVYGVVGDALLELGRYPAAFRALQRFVDTLPGLSSYARVSYARELRGDTAGAIDAMSAALQVASTQSDAAWASFHLGELSFNAGRLNAAERAYRDGSKLDPTAVMPLAGLAKVAWARGDIEGAIAGMSDVTARYPSPEYVSMLGDLQALSGDIEGASHSYDLVRAEAELLRANGVDTDLELALFEAEHGDPATALQMARDEWRRRQSVHVADALAWALHANGMDDEAARYARVALHLGTRNALFVYHAGMIQLALGRDTTARRFLANALDINPSFSVLGAEQAADALSGLLEAG
jgi:tetratricopeptide (TPR) repeat protein